MVHPIYLLVGWNTSLGEIGPKQPHKSHVLNQIKSFELKLEQKVNMSSDKAQMVIFDFNGKYNENKVTSQNTYNEFENYLESCSFTNISNIKEFNRKY